jgi:exosortase/archaeosortase family protein
VWEKVVLLASAIPIALIVNVLRISTTALCFHFFGTDELRMPLGFKLPHDWAGYLMMPVALVVVWAELRLLSWLVVETEEEPETAAFGRTQAVSAGKYRAIKTPPKPGQGPTPEDRSGGGEVKTAS